MNQYLNKYLIAVSFLLSVLNIYLCLPVPIRVKLNDDPIVQMDAGTHFHFDINKATYLEDKPFYSGKHGGMHSRPNIDLGDKIWRINNEKREEIGTVTEINWDIVRGGLEIQFSPKENTKINVGEQVWVKIDPTN